MLTPHQHVEKQRKLNHPFQQLPDLPLDLQFAASSSIPDFTTVRHHRLAKAPRISELADKTESLDKRTWEIIPNSVKFAAGKARLGLLTLLTFILRWPDWQMTFLYTRGFWVAGIIEPSNIYPLAKSKAEMCPTRLLEKEEADT